MYMLAELLFNWHTANILHECRKFCFLYFLPIVIELALNNNFTNFRNVSMLTGSGALRMFEGQESKE